MKVVETICSRHKHGDSDLLPARERYSGAHVKRVDSIAERSGMPFYILSGKYGLISADEKIPQYDFPLDHNDVESLAETVRNQLRALGVAEVDFYIEDKESWEPYIQTMQKGAQLADTLFHIYKL